MRKVLSEKETMDTVVGAALAAGGPQFEHSEKLKVLHESHEEMRRRLAAAHRGYRRLLNMITGMDGARREHGLPGRNPLLAAARVEGIIAQVLAEMGPAADAGVDPTVG